MLDEELLSLAATATSAGHNRQGSEFPTEAPPTEPEPEISMGPAVGAAVDDWLDYVGRITSRRCAAVCGGAYAGISADPAEDFVALGTPLGPLRWLPDPSLT